LAEGGKKKKEGLFLPVPGTLAVLSREKGRYMGARNRLPMRERKTGVWGSRDSNSNGFPGGRKRTERETNFPRGLRKEKGGKNPEAKTAAKKKGG